MTTDCVVVLYRGGVRRHDAADSTHYASRPTFDYIMERAAGPVMTARVCIPASPPHQ